MGRRKYALKWIASNDNRPFYWKEKVRYNEPGMVIMFVPNWMAPRPAYSLSKPIEEDEWIIVPGRYSPGGSYYRIYSSRVSTRRKRMETDHRRIHFASLRMSCNVGS